MAKGGKLSGKHCAWLAGCLVLLGMSRASAFEKLAFVGGTQMGYTYGQNGYSWPSPQKDILGNLNRGGFYLSQLRLQAHIDFDSSFMGVVTGNLIASDVQDAYLQKRWGGYQVRAGKFRGAGLKSATGVDEFERPAVNPPRYARLWGVYTRLINFRDFGIEVERDFRAGDVRNRFFFHNANGENVFNDEPSGPAGKITQVLGLDYALDWRISPYTVWGGHIGALADHSWSEFVGNHEGWQANYWFKSNAVVDGSMNHQMDLGRFHMFNEALVMYHRDILNPLDSTATKTWGVSSLIRFEHSERWGSLFRYEFFDNTDGLNADDAQHLVTLGAVYRPSPAAYPGMKITTEYVRTVEEGVQNTFPNDILYCQFQMSF
jgi:hypothetical protein